jgi:tetratricopeptide (TPR) repeat protein
MSEPSAGTSPPEAAVPLGPDAVALLDQLGRLGPRERLALLQADQQCRWQRGERPWVEDYLLHVPDLRADAEALLDLIYAEILLRQDAGEAPQPNEYLRRFPEYADQLRRQFSVDRALQDGLLRAAGPAEPSGEPPNTFVWGPSLDTPPQPPGGATLLVYGPSPAAPEPAYPEVAGYRILGVLSRGGMGVVYRAEQVGLKRVVALKMILAGAHAGPEQLARFRAEAEAVARLQHPNIVQIYEVGEQDGLPFFSLEFVEGGSLEKRLRKAPQPARAAAELVETLARAVQAAHERGIVHRDLKPANVLLAACGLASAERHAGAKLQAACVPKITDFGLAKQVDREGGPTQEGAVLGTPSYMAPEQALGLTREIGPAADVWALGAILYEMLTGRPPFQGESSLDTLQLVLVEEPVPVRRLQPRVPRDLETICLKCLQKPARKRYARALDLADDLRRFRSGEPIRARPVGRVERGLKWVRRYPAWAALWALGGAACLALIAGGSLWSHARAQAEVGRARAAAAEARAAQREAERKESLERLRARVQQCLLAGRDAQAQGVVAEARKQADEAQALVGDEPSLADLREPVVRLAAEVERREVLRRNYGRLFAGRDEALFHLNRQLFTGLDQGESLGRARQEAEEALRPFAGAADAGRPLVLDELYSPQQKAEIVQGCYEVLLIQAEATAGPVPGQPAAEQRDRAGQALALLERADALVPGTRAVHRRRERYLARLGDEAGARREHDLAAAEGPTTPLDSFLVGYDALEDGRPRDAVASFDRAVRERGDLFWAYFFRALAYQQLQRPADARADLTVCIARRPDFLWSYLLRGFLHGEVGAQAAAEERLRTALAARPADPDLEARRWDAGAETAGAFQSAEADLDTAEKLEKLHPDAAARYVLLVNRGVLRIRQGRSADAVAVLQEAVGLDAAQAQAHADLAEAYRKLGQVDAALAELGEALARGGPAPGQAALYRTRARLHLQRQDLDAALHDLQDAARKDGEALRAAPRRGNPAELADDHLEQALVLYRGERYAEAVRGCEEALNLRPEFVVAHRLAGLALMQLGRYREAVAAFDRYAEKGVPVADVFRARAHAHAELGDAAAAVRDYSRALDLKPQDPALHAARGWAYLATDAPRLALADFHDAVRLAPDDADAYCGRGYAEVRLAQSAGAVAQAVTDADEARRRQPGDPTTLLHAARVYAQAVGRLDADAFPPGPRPAEMRALYQDRAVAGLRDALEHTPAARQAPLWRQIEKDVFLSPVRRGPAFRRLAVEYGRTGQP